MSAFLAGRREAACPLRLKNDTPSFKWMLKPGQLIDGAIETGHWEPISTWVCETLVHPGMTCLDIGANIGYYTVLLGHLVGAGGRVLAFEAMGEPAQLAAAHVRLNSMEDRCVVRQAAVGATPRADSLFFNYSWPPDPTASAAELIEVCTIDELVGFETWLAGRQIDFIKIDVDGYEMRVLRGAESVLQAHRPLILLEVCDYTLRHTDARDRTPYAYGSCVVEMLTFLQNLNYRFYFEEDFSEASSFDAVLARRDLSRYSINLVCDPRVK